MKHYTISQLSQLSHINLETIRYYEKIRLIEKASRGENGYRYFTPTTVDELNFIRTCRSIGFSIDEIKQLRELKQNPTNNCEMADRLVKDHLKQIEKKMGELAQIKSFLESIDCSSQGTVTDCKVIRTLQQL